MSITREKVFMKRLDFQSRQGEEVPIYFYSGYKHELYYFCMFSSSTSKIFLPSFNHLSKNQTVLNRA